MAIYVDVCRGRGGVGVGVWVLCSYNTRVYDG